MVAGIMKKGTVHLEGHEWWLAQDEVRSYDRLLERIMALPDYCQILPYGTIRHGDYSYEMKCVLIGDPYNGKPTVGILCGVHGYEEGGVEGGLAFILQDAPEYLKHFNFVVFPCVSPSGYERDMRLTAQKINPNRNFKEGTTVPETKLVMDMMRKLNISMILTDDKHETTFSDGIIALQEGAKDLDHRTMARSTYVLEFCRSARHEVGSAMIRAIEKMRMPVCRMPKIFDIPNDNGVIRQIPRLGFSMNFMVRPTADFRAVTAQAITTEPYVSESLYHHPDSLIIRRNMQRNMLRAALNKQIALGRDRSYTPYELKRAA